jgi:hypothetical protein
MSEEIDDAGLVEHISVAPADRLDVSGELEGGLVAVAFGCSRSGGDIRLRSAAYLFGLATWFPRACPWSIGDQVDEPRGRIGKLDLARSTARRPAVLFASRVRRRRRDDVPSLATNIESGQEAHDVGAQVFIRALRL